MAQWLLAGTVYGSVGTPNLDKRLFYKMLMQSANLIKTALKNKRNRVFCTLLRFRTFYPGSCRHSRRRPPRWIDREQPRVLPRSWEAWVSRVCSPSCRISSAPPRPLLETSSHGCVTDTSCSSSTCPRFSKPTLRHSSRLSCHPSSRYAFFLFASVVSHPPAPLPPGLLVVVITSGDLFFSFFHVPMRP